MPKSEQVECECCGHLPRRTGHHHPSCWLYEVGSEGKLRSAPPAARKTTVRMRAVKEVS